MPASAAGLIRADRWRGRDGSGIRSANSSPSSSSVSFAGADGLSCAETRDDKLGSHKTLAKHANANSGRIMRADLIRISHIVVLFTFVSYLWSRIFADSNAPSQRRSVNHRNALMGKALE